MNREIKFRAWDKENKHMLYSSSDGVLECGEGQHEDVLNIWLDGTIEIANSERNYFPNGIGTINDSEKRFILQQYTGLEDKNGKEIYEGDIVKSANWLYRVGYGVETSSFGNASGFYFASNAPSLGKGFVDSTFNSLECEVIGNIYENPELLEHNKLLQEGK